MKKALDYVSDYQLKSACKDAIRIAPSKVTQMIFAVLEDWYHHIVLTHSCKLVSFLHIFIKRRKTKTRGKFTRCINTWFNNIHSSSQPSYADITKQRTGLSSNIHNSDTYI